MSTLALCFTLHPAGASAAEPTRSATTLPTIKVQGEVDEPATTQIGKTTQALRDVPQSITVLSREVLDAQGATTLGEALRNVPGITLSAGEGGVIGDNINLRGFSARTDLFIDGMRDRGQYARETFYVESIEVLKGPSSMLFGRGSTGGVINQVSKQPRREAFAEFGASLGTDDYYRATADWNQPLSDTVGMRLSAFAHASDSTRDIVESERYGIAPSLRIDLGESTHVVATAMHQRRDDVPDYGFPLTADGTLAHPARPVAAGRDDFFGFTDDRFEQDSTVASVRLTHALSPALSLRNQVQFSTVDIHARPTRISNAGVRDRLEREIEDSSLFNQTDLIARFGSAGLQHTLLVGAELGRDTFENQAYDNVGEPPQSLTDPLYGPLPGSVVRSRGAFTDNVGETLALYLNEQLDIGEHWQLVGGVRRDRYEFDTRVTSGTQVVTTDLTKTDTMTSLRAGAVYQPDEIQTYYGSYGTSFNPSAETLTLAAANTSVDPEKNRSYELGGKWSFGGGELLLTSAVFRVEKSNARTNDPLLGVTLDGEIRVEGFELGLSGALSSEWHVLAGYTYLDGEIVRLTEAGATGGVRDGNTVPNTPEHTVSLWSTYDLPSGWQIGAGLLHSSERLLNNANTALVDGYTRVDATVAYFAERFSVRINLQNLTDEEYFEAASAGRATPAARRAALATLTWQF